MKSLFASLRNVCLTVVLTSGLAACQHEAQMQSPAELQPEPASLTFSVTLPKATISTRAGYADVDEDWENATGWTDWDKLVDGRMFYRVTAFLIDSDDRLVGFRDLYKGSSQSDEGNGFLDADGNVDTGLEFGEKVKVSFRYDNPKHGEVERLHRGRYRLMVVANYSKYEDLLTNLSVGYQDNLTAFAGLVKDIEKNFIENVGIEDFTTTNYENFFNARLDAGDDRICPQNPQPLTLVTNVNLQPGDNEVEGELVRTYSRIRIEVENNASHKEKDLELTVANLTFSNNFAQRYAYLFSDPDNEERNYTDMDRGAMTITSNDAITPFATNTKISELDADNVSNDNDEIIFDAYILESKDETNDYTYTLDLMYERCEETTTTYTRSSTTAITTTDGVKTSYATSPYFLIRSYNNTYYLGANDDNTKIVAVDSPTLTGNLEESLVWELMSSTDNAYYIKNVRDGFYVGAPTVNEIPFGSTSQTYATVFTLSENTALRIQNGTTYYWEVNDGTVRGGNWPNNNNSRNRFRFQFYPVTRESSTSFPQKQTEIVLKTIDPETAQVSEVTNIQRNNFVNVLVTVSYTPTSDNGYFTFEVKPWEKKHDNYIVYE